MIRLVANGVSKRVEKAPAQLGSGALHLRQPPEVTLVGATGDVIATHPHGHLHQTYVTVKDDPDAVPRNCQPVSVKISHSCCHVNAAMNTWLKWGRETAARPNGCKNKYVIAVSSGREELCLVD